MAHATYPSHPFPLRHRASKHSDNESDAPRPSRSGGKPATVVLALVAVGAALSVARSLFAPLVFAVMLFFLLRPAVRRLVRWHVPRPLASAMVLGTVIGGLVFATAELAGPAVAWAQRLPDAARQIEVKSRSLRYPVEHLSGAVQAVSRLVEISRPESVPRVDVVRPGILEGLLARATSAVAEIGLMVVAAFFLLIDGDALLGRLFRLAPTGQTGQRPTAVINEVGARMSAYLGTVTLVNLGLGTVLAGVLALLGLPNPVLWGGLAAVLTYVPYVGPAIGIGLVTLASFVTFPTAGTALLPPLAYFALASLEGNFVTPLVLGRRFAVRPLVLFVWLAIWAWLWSVAGAILAVPMLMLFKFICDEHPRLAAVAFFMRR
jgi:predicted PurR-regulated permease PerM